MHTVLPGWIQSFNIHTDISQKLNNILLEVNVFYTGPPLRAGINTFNLPQVQNYKTKSFAECLPNR